MSNYHVINPHLRTRRQHRYMTQQDATSQFSHGSVMRLDSEQAGMAVNNRDMMVETRGWRVDIRGWRVNTRAGGWTLGAGGWTLGARGEH